MIEHLPPISVALAILAIVCINWGFLKVFVNARRNTNNSDEGTVNDKVTIETAYLVLCWIVSFASAVLIWELMSSL